MYYPYLRARQFELLALRELADIPGIQDYICPVLEPVRTTTNNLRLAHEKFVQFDLKPYLILNPAVGDCAGDTDFHALFLNELDGVSFRPALLYRDNYVFIADMIAEHNYRDVLIVAHEDFVNEEGILNLLDTEQVSTVMLLNPSRNRRLDRQIKNSSKTYIRLDDLFETQAKNADYLNIGAHKFSEEHIYYRDDNFDGYSDFTLLPMLYDDTGFLPWAVVIHWSYLNREHDNEIWVRHFTSENNYSTANVQGKFQEAAEKACDFLDTDEADDNIAAQELEGYFTGSNPRYPGLGTIKKLSIMNHLLINFKYLKLRGQNGHTGM